MVQIPVLTGLLLALTLPETYQATAYVRRRAKDVIANKRNDSLHARLLKALFRMPQTSRGSFRGTRSDIGTTRPTTHERQMTR